MARRIPEADPQDIEAIVRHHPDGASVGSIERELAAAVSRRTLNYRLAHLVANNRLEQESKGRWARYYAPGGATAVQTAAGEAHTDRPIDRLLRLSESDERIRAYVEQPPAARKPTGCNRHFLESYKPNTTAYLTAAEKDHLRRVGKPDIGEQPAGTYARQLLNRLLIDLSWNSSRLEGNTYSLLDTKRLIEIGEA